MQARSRGFQPRLVFGREFFSSSRPGQGVGISESAPDCEHRALRSDSGSFSLTVHASFIT